MARNQKSQPASKPEPVTNSPNNSLKDKLVTSIFQIVTTVIATSAGWIFWSAQPRMLASISSPLPNPKTDSKFQVLAVENTGSRRFDSLSILIESPAQVFQGFRIESTVTPKVQLNDTSLLCTFETLAPNERVFLVLNVQGPPIRPENLTIRHVDGAMSTENIGYYSKSTTDENN